MREYRLGRIVVIGLSLLLCLANVSTQLPARAVPRTEDEAFDLPFELSDNRIIVSATINRSKTARLLLDAGADQGALTEEAVQKFGLGP